LNQRYALYFLLSFFLLAVPACGVVRTTGKVVKTAGKVGWETAKITGKVAKTTGRAAWVTGKAAGRGVRGVVYMARGRQIIRLEKDGNSFYVYVKVNKKAVGRFLVDTGASDMQISQAMATLGKQAFEDRKCRIPMGDPALRADLHKLKKVTGPTGTPRFVADSDAAGHADRAWAKFLAANAAAGPAEEYAYHQITAKDLRDRGHQMINTTNGFGRMQGAM